MNTPYVSSSAPTSSYGDESNECVSLTVDLHAMNDSRIPVTPLVSRLLAFMAGEVIY